MEYGWLERIQSARVFGHRFDAVEFEPYEGALNPHAFVARHPGRTLAPAEPVDDLLALHATAQIELRLTHSLWPWWTAVTTATVGFSGIRLRNDRGPT